MDQFCNGIEFHGKNIERSVPGWKKMALQLDQKNHAIQEKRKMTELKRVAKKCKKITIPLYVFDEEEIFQMSLRELSKGKK